MAKPCRALPVVLVGLLMVGCVTAGTTKQADLTTAEAQSFLKDKPPELQAICRRLLGEGERNEVLNLMRMGLNAMQHGDRDEAKWAFDNAIAGIEKVYAGSEQAAQARSMWVEEGSKIFKGEAYERVMAYYYRGLLDIEDGDLQNARASFRGGMLQDAFAEEEQFRCDFAMLLYLSGWCGQRIPDDTLHGPTFDELIKLRADVPLPKAEDNVLIVIETGKSPRKVADGVGHYQLKFRRGRKFIDQQVRFSVDDAPMASAYPMEDIFWQATTRGGRQFDFILAGKAEFKKKAAVVGDALGTVGSNTILAASVFNSSASELQGIGAGIGLIGVMSQVASARAKAEADTRYWNNLPDRVHVASLHLSSGGHRLSLKFLDQNGQMIDALDRNLDIHVPEEGYRLVWVRSHKQFAN